MVTQQAQYVRYAANVLHGQRLKEPYWCQRWDSQGALHDGPDMNEVLHMELPVICEVVQPLPEALHAHSPVSHRFEHHLSLQESNSRACSGRSDCRLANSPPWICV